MLGSYRAEMLKLRKRSAVWVLFGAGLLLSLIFGYLLPYLGYATGDENPQTDGVPRAEVLRGHAPGARRRTTRSAGTRSSPARSRWCSARS